MGMANVSRLALALAKVASRSYHASVMASVAGNVTARALALKQQLVVSREGREPVQSAALPRRKSLQLVEWIGGPCRDRTYDQEIKSLLLYQLS